jgi:NADH-ubiquinone oxidoreductase chain 5
MEGPTPVSALIHAATMVTAGIFLLIRCSFLFEYSNIVLLFISFIGSITCCIFAIIGFFQNDLKKIIAYSTCSQLGYMVLSCGISNYFTSIFHLFNHGFFKALLFLSAGSVIHSLLNEQDIRKMGGLSIIMPFTYLCFLIGSFAIMGFPFFTGFYSKEFLLEFCFGRFDNLSIYLFNFGVFSAFFTSLYS